VIACLLLSTMVNSTSPSGDHYKPLPFDPFCATTVLPSASALPLESPLLREPLRTAPPEEESPSSMAVHQEVTLACQEVELQGLKAGSGSGDEQGGIAGGEGGVVAAQPC
jgi:hypothetical protein